MATERYVDEARRRLLISDLQNIIWRAGLAILSRVSRYVFLWVSTLIAFAQMDRIMVAWTGYASSTWGVSWPEYLWPFFGGEYIGVALFFVWLGYAPYATYRLARWGYRTVKARF